MLRLALSILVSCTVALAAPRPAPSDDPQTGPPIRPERTGYEETSSHADVMAFLQAVTASTPGMHLTRFGYSSEGRVLPLVVVGQAADATPEAVLASGRTRVLLLANIHAGEVDGKEAMLVLLRDLAAGRHAAWADSVVLLVAPIYNADGNERLHLERSGQLGPFGGMGERATAQGFDLNRDWVKLDAPEAWSLIGLLRQYDPHVAVDLHTTDGTYIGYHLTYSPPLHPHTWAPLVSFLRQGLLPAVTRAVRERSGWEYYYYGNLPPPYAGNLAWAGMDTTAGWYTFDYRARYSNNYLGLRNRLGLLSESYSYATFADRIRASLLFAEEIVSFVHAHATAVRELTAQADAHSVAGEELTLLARHARSSEPVEILLGEVDAEPHPYSGGTVLRRREVRRPVRIYEYGTFEAIETVRAPRAYYIPAGLGRAADLLAAHGIRCHALEAPATLALERFRVDSTQVAEAPYEGHRQRTLCGAYESTTETLPAGTLVVPVEQPLGRLACYLLEPRSEDSLAAWNLLGDGVVVGGHYAVQRLPADQTRRERQE